jgi:hypothetical protein
LEIDDEKGQAANDTSSWARRREEMSGDWWTRTMGLAGRLGEPLPPSVIVTSHTIHYLSTQKFSCPTIADHREKGHCAQRVKGK